MSNLEDLKLLVESIENQDVSLVTMRSKPSGKHNTKYTIVVSSKEPRNDLKNNNKTNKKHTKKERIVLEPKQPKCPVAPPRIGLAEITSIGKV